MNQEPNTNLENTQTSIDNTNVTADVTNVNTEVTTNVTSVVNEVNNVPIAPSTVQPAVEEVNNESDNQTSSDASTEVQPALTPTVDTSAPEEVKIEVDTTPHDVPLPSDDSKKDFIIKSKKETVAEETKLREARIEEHVKKANENYKPNSKLKNFLLVFFFIFIIAFTIFLPDIHKFINSHIGKSNQLTEKEVITTGILSCSLDKSSDKFDFSYIYNFTFEDSKLLFYDKSITTKGDTTLDKEELDRLKENCNTMKDESDSIEGLTVKCTSESNSIKVQESVDLGSFTSDSLTHAYTEAGGEYPEYSLEQDISDIERNMKASGFSCDRISS